MSTTETYIGIGEDRSSSRVLKPPGGGHSNIFSPAEEIKPHARPKYDQQNSSNLNFCMNTVDPNEKVAKIGAVNESTEPAAAAAPEIVMREQESANSAPRQSETDQPDSKVSANLPQYHHHRSTALW